MILDPVDKEDKGPTVTFYEPGGSIHTIGITSYEDTHKGGHQKLLWKVTRMMG